MPDGDPQLGSLQFCGDTRASHRQRVLVLGASGFIGSHVVKALAGTDWAAPIAAGHRSMPHSPGAHATLQLDATDARALQQALRGVASVVNCVAGDARTIVSAAQALFERCAAAAPSPRVVHLSSMAVYGSATGILDESAPLKADLDAYSGAKAEAERVSRICGSVVHLRPGIVYGPGSPIWSERIGRWLDARRLGDLGSEGLGICNLVHVDDVAQAAVRALYVPGIEGQAFNLSLPCAPTWNEYFRLYAQALQVPLPSISRRRLMIETMILAAPLKLAEIAAAALRLPWRPPPPIRPWLLRLCRHRIRLNVGKAEQVLGMTWIGLEAGLRDAAAHFRLHGLLHANGRC